MSLTRKIVISLTALTVFIAVAMVDWSVSQQAEPNKTQKASAGKYVVIGSLQSRDKVVTISQGPKGIVYTVQNKNGKILAHRIKEKDLQAKYPGIYSQVKTGLAGNGAFLDKHEFGQR